VWTIAPSGNAMANDKIEAIRQAADIHIEFQVLSLQRKACALQPTQ
jgi:hypothetical protein